MERPRAAGLPLFTRPTPPRFTKSERVELARIAHHLAFVVYKIPGVCTVCGAERGDGVVIDIHHRDGDCLNNTPGNLQPLCRNCHMGAESWGVHRAYAIDDELLDFVASVGRVPRAGRGSGSVFDFLAKSPYHQR